MIVAGSRTAGRILCAPLQFASDFVPSESTDVATKAYADSHGGSGPPQERILYLTTAGPAAGITADGLTMASAFGNLYDAVAAAAAMSPSADSRVCIQCEDAGRFSISAGGGTILTIPSGVDVYMPTATVYNAFLTTPSAILMRQDSSLTADIIRSDITVDFFIGGDTPSWTYNTRIEAGSMMYHNLYLGACRNVEVYIGLFRGDINTNLPGTTYPTSAVITGDEFYGTLTLGSGYVQEDLQILFGYMNISPSSTVGSMCRVFLRADEITNPHNLTALTSTADLHVDISLQNEPTNDSSVPIGRDIAVYYEKPLEWTVRSVDFSYVTGEGTVSVPVSAMRHGRTVTITLSGGVLASVGGYSLISTEALPVLFSVPDGTPVAYAYCTNYPVGTLHTYCNVSMVGGFLLIKSSGTDGIFPADAGTVTMSTAVLVGPAALNQPPT